MKPILLSFVLALSPLAASAQIAPAPAPAPVLSGDWAGDLDATSLGGPKLPLVLHAGDQATLDSPDQGALGIGAALRKDGSRITVTLASIGATMSGQLSADGSTFSGEWTQGEAIVPFVFKKKTAPAP